MTRCTHHGYSQPDGNTIGIFCFQHPRVLLTELLMPNATAQFVMARLSVLSCMRHTSTGKPLPNKHSVPKRHDNNLDVRETAAHDFAACAILQGKQGSGSCLELVSRVFCRNRAYAGISIRPQEGCGWFRIWDLPGLATTARKASSPSEVADFSSSSAFSSALVT